MSKCSWTPGPWSPYFCGSDDTYVLGGRTGAVAKVLHAHRDNILEQEANAALIAASPALAEALENLLKWVRPIAGDNLDDAAAANELKTVEMAEAALILARGETSK